MKTLSIAQSVCIEYDEIMLHHRKTFSASHFGDTTDEDVDSNAKTVIRYALDTYLRWPRSILLKRLTMDILEKLKLKPLLRHLRYPREYNKDTGMSFLGCLRTAISPARLRFHLKTGIFLHTS